MLKRIAITFFLAALTTSCASNKPNVNIGSVPSPPANTISGTLSGRSGPLQNAGVKLKVYKDENCVKLAQIKTKLSEDQEKEVKQCIQVLASTTSDAQGKYAFPNVNDGWYSLEMNWVSSENPVKGMPLSLHREEGYLIMFIEAREDPKYRYTAIGEVFRFSRGDTDQRDLTLRNL